MAERFKNCVGMKKTAKALLVMNTSNMKQAWVPQSQIDEDSEVYAEGHEGDLMVSEWFAENGLDWKEI